MLVLNSKVIGMYRHRYVCDVHVHVLATQSEDNSDSMAFIALYHVFQLFQLLARERCNSRRVVADDHVPNCEIHVYICT